MPQQQKGVAGIRMISSGVTSLRAATWPLTLVEWSGLSNQLVFCDVLAVSYSIVVSPIVRESMSAVA